MKVLAIVLLCACAVAVQGRTAVKVVENSSSEVAQETKPWLVHLRFTDRTSGGLLHTALGTLITERWVLTTSKLKDASFIWMRFEVAKVHNPGMVLESSATRSLEPIAIIDSGRDIQISDSIAPIALGLSSGFNIGLTCGFGVSVTGGPGENLQCLEIAVEEAAGQLVGPRDILSEFDEGAGLVINNSLTGVLVAVDDQSATFAEINEELWNYISQETGVAPPPSPPQPDSSESQSNSSESESNSSESESNSSESEEGPRVKFVNF